MIYYVNPVEIAGQVASASSDIFERLSSLLSDIFFYIYNNLILCSLFVFLILFLIFIKLLEIFKNSILKEDKENNSSTIKKEEYKIKSKQNSVNIKKRIKEIKNNYKYGVDKR